MYNPKECVTSERPKEIIAIIGEPGSGKTTSCLSFPNRIWLDFDHKLPANEQSIPFWNPEFCDTIAKRTQRRANQRDAAAFWIRDNINKFSPEQTIILDSWTFFQNFIDLQTMMEYDLLPTNASGNKDKYYIWNMKLRYSKETMVTLRTAACRVVVTFHSTRERDEQGNLTGKLLPLQDGSFKDQLLGHFTDVWRQIANPPNEPNAQGMKQIINGKSYTEGYFWQLIGDGTVDTNTNPTLGMKARKNNIRRVRADYAEIQKIYDMA